MTFQRADRIFETSTTTGTGTYTLAGAVPGYRAISAVCSNADTIEYFSTDVNHGGTSWEIGLGTYSGGTLARTTIYKSSNANAAVNWSNTIDIQCDVPAHFFFSLGGTPADGDIVYCNGNTISAAQGGDVTVNTGTGLTTIGAIAGVTVNGVTGNTNVVFSNSPTLVTPVLGVATATSYNGTAISTPTNDSTATGASFGIGTSALAGQSGSNAAYNNTAVGYQTLQAGTLTTAATQNVAVGFQALNGLTQGTGNTAIGYKAGTTTIALTTGGANTLIGTNAHTAAIGTNNATAIGFGTCAGTSSTMVGINAGASGSGSSCTGVGELSLQNVTGSGNTASGDSSGKFVSSGTSNTFVGFQSGMGITGSKLTTSGNTCIGKDSGLLLQGSGAATNSMLGISSGAAVTTGSSNTIIGASVASATLATGASNIYIGCSSAIDATSSSTSNELKIGNSSTPVISATGINSAPSITLGGDVTISKAFKEKVSAVADGAGAVIDASLGNIFTWVATADRTAGTTTNPTAGQKMIISFNASGGARTLTLPTATTGDFAFGSDITTLSATASGKTDVIGCIYDSVKASRWAVVSVAKGY